MLATEKLKLQENMSETEKQIAAYILSAGRELERYSTRTLAEASYTSPASIVRLCKKLGFSGFDDFKKNYIQELQYLDSQSGEVDFNFPFVKDDTPMRAANNISQLYVETIQDTMSLLQAGELRKAVTLFQCRPRIHIYSAGTAINQAESFREKMLKIGRQVSISNNLNYQLYEVGCLSGQDLAIIISYSGETERMLQVAKECCKRHVPVIALTSFGENSLTRYASCKMTLSTKESIYQNVGDYSSHLSVNLLLDILYSAYFLQNYEANYQSKLEKARVLEKGRTSTNPILMNTGRTGEP